MSDVAAMLFVRYTQEGSRYLVGSSFMLFKLSISSWLLNVTRSVRGLSCHHRTIIFIESDTWYLATLTN